MVMSEPEDTMMDRYLSVIDEDRTYSPKLQAVTRTWINYLKEYGEDSEMAIKRLSEEYHGTYVSSGIIFRSKEDKVWFMLKWS